jgi:hypothetical protein
MPPSTPHGPYVLDRLGLLPWLSPINLACPSHKITTRRHRIWTALAPELLAHSATVEGRIRPAHKTFRRCSAAIPPGDAQSTRRKRLEPHLAVVDPLLSPRGDVGRNKGSPATFPLPPVVILGFPPPAPIPSPARQSRAGGGLTARRHASPSPGRADANRTCGWFPRGPHRSRRTRHETTCPYPPRSPLTRRAQLGQDSPTHREPLNACSRTIQGTIAPQDQPRQGSKVPSPGRALRPCSAVSSGDWLPRELVLGTHALTSPSSTHGRRPQPRGATHR